MRCSPVSTYSTTLRKNISLQRKPLMTVDLPSMCKRIDEQSFFNAACGIWAQGQSPFYLTTSSPSSACGGLGASGTENERLGSRHKCDMRPDVIRTVLYCTVVGLHAGIRGARGCKSLYLSTLRSTHSLYCTLKARTNQVITRPRKPRMCKTATRVSGLWDRDERIRRLASKARIRANHLGGELDRHLRDHEWWRLGLSDQIPPPEEANVIGPLDPIQLYFFRLEGRRLETIKICTQDVIHNDANDLDSNANHRFISSFRKDIRGIFWTCLGSAFGVGERVRERKHAESVSHFASQTRSITPLK